MPNTLSNSQAAKRNQSSNFVGLSLLYWSHERIRTQWQISKVKSTFAPFYWHISLTTCGQVLVDALSVVTSFSSILADATSPTSPAPSPYQQWCSYASSNQSSRRAPQIKACYEEKAIQRRERCPSRNAKADQSCPLAGEGWWGIYIITCHKRT